MITAFSIHADIDHMEIAMQTIEGIHAGSSRMWNVRYEM